MDFKETCPDALVFQWGMFWCSFRWIWLSICWKKGNSGWKLKNRVFCSYLETTVTWELYLGFRWFLLGCMFLLIMNVVLFVPLDLIWYSSRSKRFCSKLWNGMFGDHLGIDVTSELLMGFFWFLLPCAWIWI